MDYRGFTIRMIDVLVTKGTDINYHIVGKDVAFQVISRTGFVLGTFTDIDWAKKMIDKNGRRWQKLEKPQVRARVFAHLHDDQFLVSLAV